MNQLLEVAKTNVDLKKLSEQMPGRTPKALSHKWTAIKADLAKVKEDPNAVLGSASTPRKKKADADADGSSPTKKPRAKKAVTSKEDSKEEGGADQPSPTKKSRTPKKTAATKLSKETVENEEGQTDEI